MAASERRSWNPVQSWAGVTLPQFSHCRVGLTGVSSSQGPCEDRLMCGRSFTCPSPRGTPARGRESGGIYSPGSLLMGHCRRAATLFLCQRPQLCRGPLLRLEPLWFPVTPGPCPFRPGGLRASRPHSWGTCQPLPFPITLSVPTDPLLDGPH